MIVPEAPWPFVDINPLSHGYHGGCIGAEVECEPESKPRRPIGFRMPEREPVIEDPSWILL